ncbi:uncharacterized protein LOC120236188 [Hyaena hyaena]|uniref:uncharacterized protein LOC120236188 n=1 Tax=Hyaena hyaena TaxID=95912 RepID=UPI0019245301|nr:uncharacterized protein LOC120236188 [Hyaena hyaena]
MPRRREFSTHLLLVCFHYGSFPLAPCGDGQLFAKEIAEGSVRAGISTNQGDEHIPGLNSTCHNVTPELPDLLSGCCVSTCPVSRRIGSSPVAPEAEGTGKQAPTSVNTQDILSNTSQQALPQALTLIGRTRIQVTSRTCHVLSYALIRTLSRASPSVSFWIQTRSPEAHWQVPSGVGEPSQPRRLHGRHSHAGSRTQKGPAPGSMLCRHHLKVLVTVE